MLKSNFKIAWRQLQKNKLISAINIFGLGIGLAVGIFVLLYTRYELSYEQSIPDKENIYRVYRPYNGGAKGNRVTPEPVGRAMREQIPGVFSACRVNPGGNRLVEYNREHFTIESSWLVDSTFFLTIPLQFVRGKAETAFAKFETAVISEKIAEKIFGIENPIGKIILYENEQELEITGVFASHTAPSHLNADMYVALKREKGYWTGGDGFTYARIGPSTNTESVKSALFEIARREIIKEDLEDGEETDLAALPKWELQPLDAIHMGSAHLGERGPSAGSFQQLNTLSIIGLLILLLAAINYINLVTAQMSVRAKEIGIRNVSGATRQQLIAQFLSEALLTAFCAMLVALFLTMSMLPFFNETISRPIPIMDLFSGATPLLIVGLTLFTGFTSGIFPALYFSRIEPAKSLKAEFLTGKKTGVYRNVLIIAQFVLSIGLTLFVCLVWRQIDFMLKKDLGFQKEQIAVFGINREKTADQFLSKKHQIENIPGVAAVSQVSRHPGGRVPNYTISIDGVEKKEQAWVLFGDTEWNEVFQIPIKEGRYFSNLSAGASQSGNIHTDTTAAFVVNETFVKRFGLKNPIGHQVKFAFDEHYSTIIGVVEDFHYEGLNNEIAPVILCSRMNEAWMGRAAIRFEANQSAEVLTKVSSFWKNMEPSFPVTYSFLDEEFAKQYESYRRFGTSLTYATIICLFLALIGLFGLTVFILQRKTKEIGIRKVLGASVPSIVGLLSKDFLRLTLIAFVIAAPVAWYFASSWLQNFAYQQTGFWLVFVGVGLATLGVVFLTVSLQSLKAAMSNPVESIRVD
ncbi:MAG: ABC transporter permease [Saprospiraceae bacterium]